MQAFSLSGRTALVTGASRGIGWAIAQALVAAGARLILSGRDESVLEERVAQLVERGSDAQAAPFDVSSPDAAIKGFDDAVAAAGRIDILVNNAGTGMRRAIADTDDADFTRVIDTNLRGPFHLIRSASAHMGANGGGSIVNVGSALSILGRENASLYTASKHGLAGLTKSLARELAPLAVRINAVCPGYVMTEMMTAQQADADFDKAVRDRTPLGRWASPDEIGGAVVFLASDAASYVTGHLLAVDGGLTVSV